MTGEVQLRLKVTMSCLICVVVDTHNPLDLGMVAENVSDLIENQGCTSFVRDSVDKVEIASVQDWRGDIVAQPVDIT